MKLQSNLQKSLNAIKSYQTIEELNAVKLNMKVQSYRKQVRKEFNVEFNTEFLTPSNINNLIENNVK